MRAKLRDVEAYVTRSELVARFGPGTISFLNTPIEFLERDSVRQTGTGSAAPAVAAEDGVFRASRARTSSCERIPYGANATLGITICSNRRQLCRREEALVQRRRRHRPAPRGPDRPCDLTTFGLGIETVP